MKSSTTHQASGKRILIIYTGGTIGMAEGSKAKSLVPLDLNEIKSQLPELNRLNCRLQFRSFTNPIDSSNVHPSFWKTLAGIIEKNYSNHDGFVVLHGTDTMAYTASALSFMFENLSKPVILTGSQVPLGTIRTDARRNLITAVEIAASANAPAEVCIYFNNFLFRGNRAEKFTSSKFDAFQSLNCPPLAEAGVQIVFARNTRPHKKGKLKIRYGFDTSVILLKLFPGLTNAMLKSMLSDKRLKAAVIETYGSGNAPSDKEFLDVLKEASRRGLLLVNISQCSGGRVEQGKYETSIHLSEIGMIPGGDMTTEAAMVKLMFLLAHHKSSALIKKEMQKNLRGELTA
jgi:L-asparaginase